MAGNCLWIALFLTLQISFVLCRSTGKPDEDGKEFIVSPTGEVPKAEALEETVAPGEVTNADVPKHMAYSSMDDAVEASNTAVIVVLVLYFVFLAVSFILGCILYSRSKSRAVRRGHIVNSNTGVQSFGIQPNTTM